MPTWDAGSCMRTCDRSYTDCMQVTPRAPPRERDFSSSPPPGSSHQRALGDRLLASPCSSHRQSGSPRGRAWTFEHGQTAMILPLPQVLSWGSVPSNPPGSYPQPGRLRQGRLPRTPPAAVLARLLRALVNPLLLQHDVPPVRPLARPLARAPRRPGAEPGSVARRRRPRSSRPAWHDDERARYEVSGALPAPEAGGRARGCCAVVGVVPRCRAQLLGILGRDLGR